MINLSLDELTAQIRNISGYENKSKEDLIKALKAGFQHADFSASADFYASADFSAYPQMNSHHNPYC